MIKIDYEYTRIIRKCTKKGNTDLIVNTLINDTF